MTQDHPVRVYWLRMFSDPVLAKTGMKYSTALKEMVEEGYDISPKGGKTPDRTFNTQITRKDRYGDYFEQMGGGVYRPKGHVPPPLTSTRRAQVRQRHKTLIAQRAKRQRKSLEDRLRREGDLVEVTAHWRKYPEDRDLFKAFEGTLDEQRASPEEILRGFEIVNAPARRVRKVEEFFMTLPKEDIERELQASHSAFASDIMNDLFLRFEAIVGAQVEGDCPHDDEVLVPLPTGEKGCPRCHFG